MRPGECFIPLVRDCHDSPLSGSVQVVRRKMRPVLVGATGFVAGDAFIDGGGGDVVEAGPGEVTVGFGTGDEGEAGLVFGFLEKAVIVGGEFGEGGKGILHGEGHEFGKGFVGGLELPPADSRDTFFRVPRPAQIDCSRFTTK